jgi:uncharacterized protein
VTMPLEAIRTPCVGICELVVPWGICKGCGRTESELGAWAGMSDDERDQVMLDCDARLAVLFNEPLRLLKGKGNA